MPFIRGRSGAIPYLDARRDLLAIKAWRQTEWEAGRPDGLRDWYEQSGVCFQCQGHGAVMVGWSPPTSLDEIASAEKHGLEELPVYDVCAICIGTGKSVER